MYLKAAKLAEAMQLAATPNQSSVRSPSPEAVSHGGLRPHCIKLLLLCPSVHITFLHYIPLPPPSLLPSALIPGGRHHTTHALHTCHNVTVLPCVLGQRLNSQG